MCSKHNEVGWLVAFLTLCPCRIIVTDWVDFSCQRLGDFSWQRLCWLQLSEVGLTSDAELISSVRGWLDFSWLRLGYLQSHTDQKKIRTPALLMSQSMSFPPPSSTTPFSTRCLPNLCFSNNFKVWMVDESPLAKSASTSHCQSGGHSFTSQQRLNKKLIHLGFDPA